MNVCWEIKLKSGESFTEAQAEYIDYGSGVVKMMVLIRPKKVETRRFWVFRWEAVVQEALHQAVLVVPLDHVAYIRLKVEDKKEEPKK
jgi:hypothetical protein